MSPLPRVVEQAGRAALERRRDPSKIVADDFFARATRLREAFASLVGVGDPSSVAIIPAVSYGIETVVRNADLRAGRNVVVLGDQFPSNVYPWRRACEASGAGLTTVESPDVGPNRAARWSERVIDAIDADTQVVAIESVHWNDGTRFDVEAIGTRARDVDALYVVDGSQSVGALPFDVGSVRPDALVCAGYKWLFGPYGIGVAYYGERLHGGEPVEATWLVRREAEDFSRLTRYIEAYQPGAVRFDVGERSNFIHVAMQTAAIDLLLEWQVSEIQAYCRDRFERPLALAADLGFDVGGPEDRASHLAGLRAPDPAIAAALRAAFEAAGIFASVRGEAIRISCHVFIDDDDIDALCRAMEDVVT